jgi:hypothetical protein
MTPLQRSPSFINEHPVPMALLSGTEHRFPITNTINDYAVDDKQLAMVPRVPYQEESGADLRCAQS